MGASKIMDYYHACSEVAEIAQVAQRISECIKLRQCLVQDIAIVHF